MPQLLRTIDGFPGRHGVTLRTGGVSSGAHASLNVGDAVGDAPDRVAVNRARIAARLDVPLERIVTLEQVHGDRVVTAAEVREAAPGTTAADAVVSDDPEDVLAIGVADCRPVLFHDPASGAAAAAHCGWRGALAGLTGKVVAELSERFGSDPADLHVTVGPGIAGACYQVGPEVVTAFADAGFPGRIAWPDDEGRFRLDLAAAIESTLRDAGVRAERIHVDPACTHCDPERFFSYRRDGVTGRHWALVRPGPAGSI